MESADYNYHETGGHHDNTKTHEDGQVLADRGVMPRKITSLKIYWLKYCIGFEAFYDGVSAGACIGTDYSGGATFTEMILDDDEYITEIAGRSGSNIDHIIIHTNTGRKQQFGSSQSGGFFSLREGGKIVKDFTVGYNNCLHFFGANFGSPNDIFTKSETVGGSNPGTSSFDDLDPELRSRSGIEITNIEVSVEDNVVTGLSVISKLDGTDQHATSHLGGRINPSTPKESITIGRNHIVKISGRCGESIDQLTFTLQDGSIHSFGGEGGSPFENIVPEGKKVVAFGGGVGSYLDNFFCYYQ